MAALSRCVGVGVEVCTLYSGWLVVSVVEVDVVLL